MEEIPSANAEAVQTESLTDKLTSFFSEETQVDNQPTEEVQEVQEVPQETEVKTEEVAEQTEDTAEVEQEEEPEEVDEFEQFESKQTEYPDLEALKAKYPRQQHKLLEEAAKFAHEAKAKSEIVQGFGGQSYIEPAQKLTASIRENKTFETLQNIMAMTSEEGLARHITDTVEAVFVQAERFKMHPDTAQLGEFFEQIGNAAIKQRFGEGATPELIGKLLANYENGFISDEDLEGVEISKPDQKLVEEVKRLKDQLAQKEETNKKQDSTAEAESYGSFQNTVNDAIEKVLETVWERSPLKENPADTDEAKAHKRLFRNNIAKEAVSAFKAQSLFSDFKRGKSNLPAYKEAFAEAVEQAVLSVRETAATYKQLFAKLHNNSRNAQVMKPKPKPESTEQPTQTTSFREDRKADVKTVQKSLENWFAQNE